MKCLLDKCEKLSVVTCSHIKSCAWQGTPSALKQRQVGPQVAHWPVSLVNQ